MIWTSLPELDLDDQDAGRPVGLVVLGQAERNPQIVDRHDVAAEVDHPQQRLRAAGHFGQRLHVEDFLDPHHLERIAFSAQSEDDVRLGPIAIGSVAGVHHDIDHHPTLHDYVAIECSQVRAQFDTDVLTLAAVVVLAIQRASILLHENRSKLSSSSRLTTTPPRGEAPVLLGGGGGARRADPGARAGAAAGRSGPPVASVPHAVLPVGDRGLPVAVPAAVFRERLAAADAARPAAPSASARSPRLRRRMPLPGGIELEEVDLLLQARRLRRQAGGRRRQARGWPPRSAARPPRAG